MNKSVKRKKERKKRPHRYDPNARTYTYFNG